MSYQTGAATSTVDLLQQLVTWLVSIGWTQDRSASEGLGWTASLHKSGNYVHLRATMNESTPWYAGNSGSSYALDLFLGTAYNAALGWCGQATGAPVSIPGAPVGVGMHLSAGPFTNYFFFADAAGDNIVIVVQVSPVLFVHLGWGLSLTKAGSWTGGPYFFGSTSGYGTTSGGGGASEGFNITSDCPFVRMDALNAACGFVRADVDTFTGKWLAISPTTNASYGYQGKVGDSSVRGYANAMPVNFPVYAYSSYSYHFQYEQVSAQDGRANLLPILLWALRDGTTTGYSLLGTVPNVFVANAVGNGFSPADEYVLGGTTYKLFPNFAVVKQ